MLSVLMVTNNYPTAESPYMGSATALQERGLRELGVDVDIALFDRTRYGRAVYRGMGGKISALLKEKKYDLVHVQFGGISAYHVVKVCGRRSVITFHGTDLHGGVPRGVIQRVSFGIGGLASRWAARRAGWNIAVSRDLATHLNGITSRFSVVTPGVDFDFFQPIPREEALNALGLSPHRKRIVFCDSMRADVKRRDLAEAALKYVRKKGIDAEFLELHHVPHSKVPLCLNAADCLLVTSDKEGSPNIVKEAIATGLPIVSVNVGDVSERVQGISNCTIVPREVSEIGAALVEILMRGGRANGRSLKRNELENKNVCRKILDVYESLLSELTADAQGSASS